MPTRPGGAKGELFRALPPTEESAWRESVERDLRGRGPDALATALLEGFSVGPLHVRGDRAAGAAFPGLAPYTRDRVALPRSEWTVCQEHDVDGPGDVSAAIESDVARGVSGLWLRFSPASQDKLAGTLSHVPLRSTQVLLAGGPAAGPARDALVRSARAIGMDPADLVGVAGCDPLGVLARDGRLPTSLQDAYRAMGELARVSITETPHLHAVLIDARAYHDAGATAVEEVAYALATLAAYLRRLAPPRRGAGGLDATSVARTTSAAFSVGGDLFVEIAKLRAARLSLSKVLRAAGAGPDVRSLPLHTRTAWRTKTRRDPWVNVVRACVETFAAALGGADSVTTAPHDEPLGTRSEPSRRLATNTALILARESHVTRVLDPLGGSHYVESLTLEIARAAWTRFQAIESIGGMEIAIQRGEIFKETNVSTEARARAIAERRDPIVGVSVYANPREERSPPPPVKTPPRRAEDERDSLGTGSDPATAPPLIRRRLSERFEALRDVAEARSRAPRVFLAAIGNPRTYGPRAVFTRRLLEAGGFLLSDAGGFSDAGEAAVAFERSGADLAAIAGTDDAYAERVEPFARALAERGARRILLAGRAGGNERAWRAAGVTDFVHAGVDAIELLASLLAEEVPS